jgi:hypothetical protein
VDYGSKWSLTFLLLASAYSDGAEEGHGSGYHGGCRPLNATHTETEPVGATNAALYLTDLTCLYAFFSGSFPDLPPERFHYGAQF